MTKLSFKISTKLQLQNLNQTSASNIDRYVARPSSMKCESVVKLVQLVSDLSLSIWSILLAYFRFCILWNWKSWHYCIKQLYVIPLNQTWQTPLNFVIKFVFHSKFEKFSRACKWKYTVQISVLLEWNSPFMWWLKRL